MLTHTIVVNQLDTITKHLIEINQQLVAIKTEKSFNEDLKTFALVASPFLSLFAAWLIFRLTRSKEHHQKKSELCGEIYAYIEELKMANADWVTSHILFQAALRSNQIVFEKIASDSERQIVAKMMEDLKIEMEAAINKHNAVMRNLRKQVGTFRFYLPESKRIGIDNLMEPFSKRWMLDYDFSDLKEIEEVTNKINEINQKYIDEQAPIDSERYEALLKFIDGQNVRFFTK